VVAASKFSELSMTAAFAEPAASASPATAVSVLILFVSFMFILLFGWLFFFVLCDLADSYPPWIKPDIGRN
jgi:hypothetical protein